MICGRINYPVFYTPSDVEAARCIAKTSLEGRFIDEVDIAKGEADEALNSAQLVIEQLGVKAVGVDTFDREILAAYTRNWVESVLSLS